METIIKIIFIFIGLFVIANGVWVILMPPFGDELTGIVIIAAGICIPVITLSITKKNESRYD
jgi:hypothetical protein